MLGGDGDSSSSALRRAAELLEWIGDLADTDAAPLLVPLSAACYQLAGYPARASGVLRSAAPEARESLLGLLLAGHFERLLEESTRVAVTLRIPLARREQADGGDDTTEAVTSVVIAEVASALGVICSELRWGEEWRAEQALSKLRSAGSVLTALRNPFVWLSARLSGEVASRILRDSLRVQIRQLGEEAPAGRDVFERYVRLAFSSNRAVAWPSQIRGLDRLALGDSFALCTPTGSGKTTVAEVALLDGLFRDVEEGVVGFDEDAGAPLCLYIVPTRALAAEVEAKLSRVLRQAGGPRALTVTGLYGGTDWGPSDVWLTNEEPTVLICTQEKAEALIRFFGGSFLHRLRLVILDEAHNVQFAGNEAALISGEDRALRLESLVSRLRAHLAERRTRFIALSAVAQNIELPLARWIGGTPDGTPVRSEYRSTRQLVGRLHCQERRRFRIVYDRLDGAPLSLGVAQAQPFVPNPFPAHPAAPRMSGPAKGLAPYALWAAIQLASESGGPAQSVLISIAQQPRNFANWCIQLLEDEWAGADLPQFFPPPARSEDQEIWQQALSACEDYFGVESREYRLLVRGIVVHHGKMPGRLPRVLVQLLERRIVRIAIATSTLSEGVNLPFETVLIPSLRRQQSGLLSGREFGNLVGRVGRPGVSTEGQALVLILEASTAAWQRRRAVEDYLAVLQDWSSPDAERDSASSALASLIEAIAAKWPGGDEHEFLAWLEQTAPVTIDDVGDGDAIKALDALDALLIAALTELQELSDEEEPVDREGQLRRIWRSTFAHYSASEERRLEEIFVDRGRALVRNIYPDRGQRRRYYRASIPPRDAEQLYELVNAFRDHIASGRDYASWSRDEQLDFVQDAIAMTAELDRFELRTEVGRSKAPWRDVVEWWLSPSSATRQPTESQVADWINFADGDVSYRFNWAVGAMLGLLTDEVSDEDARHWATPEDWEATGLPFIALWLKDLILWGTLDPVAAYLLARGGAVVRSDAEALANGYYEDRLRSEPEADPLDPSAIREWAAAVIPGRQVPQRARAPQRIPARLLRRFRSPNDELRVLPQARNGRLLWVDPAGFWLARSDLPTEWNDEFVRRADFFLQPSSRMVVSRNFV